MSKIKSVKRPDAVSIIKEEHRISFSFRMLHPISYTDTDARFFVKFFERLKKLSEFTWKQIDVSARHSFGYEKIPVSKIRPKVNLTSEIKELHVFRATGDNHSFLGFRIGDVFNVVFIEANFGDIYKH